jgi:hypothetical protein
VSDPALEGAIVRYRERLEALEVAIDGPAPLPSARVGRSSRLQGGWIARAWAWVILPRVERFRYCARCGLTLDADRERSLRRIERSGARYCTGWMGEPYNRCMSATYRYG